MGARCVERRELFYTIDDDGIHMRCRECGDREHLGVHPDISAVVAAAKECPAWPNGEPS